MRVHIMQTLDLFRTVFIHENGIAELYLPELTDLKNVCKNVIELADKQEQEWRRKRGEEV